MLTFDLHHHAHFLHRRAMDASRGPRASVLARFLQLEARGRRRDPSWACQLLHEHGYRDVRVHVGGLAAWVAAGLHVDREP